MIKLEKEVNNNNKWAVITAIYKGMRYSSIPLELAQNSENLKLVLTISETGSNATQMMKFPVGDTKFMVFSKEQLVETLLEVEIFDNKPAEGKTKGSKKSGTQPSEIIKS